VTTLLRVVERVAGLAVVATRCSRPGAHLLDVLVHVAQRLRGRKVEGADTAIGQCSGLVESFAAVCCCRCADEVCGFVTQTTNWRLEPCGGGGRGMPSGDKAMVSFAAIIKPTTRHEEATDL
jgi:hypothetical protein